MQFRFRDRTEVNIMGVCVGGGGGGIINTHVNFP